MPSFNSIPWVDLTKDDLVIVEESLSGTRGKARVQNFFALDFTDFPLWDDLRFPATAINPPGAASDPDWDVTDGGWLFDPGSTEVLYLVAQLPHTWIEGSTLKPHVHWEKSTSAAGNVLWQLRYEWSSIGQVRSTLTTLNASTPEISDQDTADLHAITPLGDIDGTGRGISDMLMMRLERVGGNPADTYDADVRLLEFDIHFQIGRIGTEEQF